MRHGVTVVIRFFFTDRSKELIMLCLIHIVLLARILPVGASGDLMPIPGTVNQGFPPVAEYFQVVTVLAILLLEAKMKASGAVIVFIRYGKQVVHMAKNRSVSYMRATSSERVDRSEERIIGKRGGS